MPKGLPPDVNLTYRKRVLPTKKKADITAFFPKSQALFFPDGKVKKRKKDEDCLRRSRVPQAPLFCAGGGKKKNNRLTLLLLTFTSKEK